jgi:hypothetical protein
LTQSGIEPKPLVERALPQASIRFFIFLIALSAVAMLTFRAAIVGGHLWAKIGSLLIATSIGCFLTYAGLFLVAFLFSTATSALWSALFRRGASTSHDPPRPSSGDI